MLDDLCDCPLVEPEVSVQLGQIDSIVSVQFKYGFSLGLVQIVFSEFRLCISLLVSV
ncbi:MAG: hypothetical protein PQJ50_17525 [Spirochaetales bacterium]|nr:hypothetical protein [Spirochaetales bacterium]